MIKDCSKLYLLLLLLLPLIIHSQDFRVSGKVVDSKTKEPLAFVNIVINSGVTGGTTDIDGKFLLRSTQKIQYLRLSYVGYIPQRVEIREKTSNLLITMTRTELDLREVEILPGINPAHRIIRNAIENREINDPEKLNSFSYTAYDKTIFTVDKDTLKRDTLKNESGISFVVDTKTDSVINDTARNDSSELKLSQFLEKQNIFLMENVTKRKFLSPDRNYNQVIATRMSGFHDPIFVFLTTQIQSFSFYKPFITIFQSTYVNPVSSGSLSKYFFKIEDTTYNGNDTVFTITFRPRKGTNFDGLKGVISINSNRWAIQNVIAQPARGGGGIHVKIQQMYEFIDSTAWFPVQLNTDVSFLMFKVGKYSLVARGRSYIRDIQLNPEMVRREFNHLDVEVDKQATERDESYWEKYRTDSLTAKDRRTYEVLDSIGKEENFDKAAKGLKTILSGRIPYKFIDFDLNRILGYNRYEGIIAGLGIHTNERISKFFRIGGFYQYSFAISTSKYGGDATWLLNRRNDLAVSAGYSFDLTGSGMVKFFDDKESILSGNFAPLFLRKLDRTENFNGSVTIRLRKYWLTCLGFSRSFKKSSTNDFSTIVENVTLQQNQFIFSELTAGFKWAYKEKFLQTIDEKMSLGTNFPVVWLQYTRGLKGILEGEYEYNKVDMKIFKSIKFKYTGKLNITATGGYIDRPIPATNMYYGQASFASFSLFAPGTFNTMRMNEFLSDRYVSLFLYHDFGYMLYKGKKWFHPEFALSQSIGFGWLEHPERYSDITLKPKVMDLGYYESGLLINNLINLRLYNLGIGTFYRWGPYSFDKTGNNFSFKVSVMFPF